MSLGRGEAPDKAIGAATGHFVEVPGGRLWCVDSGGSGVPIVFLHANTGTSESWAAQVDFFSRAGYRSIAYDRRGWGRSEFTGRDAVVGTVAEDLEVLTSSLELPRFHLVSVAGGAFHALDYAAWRGERLRSLVVGATTGDVEEDEVHQFMSRVRIPAIWPPHDAVVREVSPGYRGSNPGGTAEWAALEASARHPQSPVQQLRSPNTFAKLHEISVAVLAVAGGADLLAPPAVMRLWTKALRNVELVVMAEAGHSIAWEDPDSFNAHVLDFVRRQS